MWYNYIKSRYVLSIEIKWYFFRMEKNVRIKKECLFERVGVSVLLLMII